MVESSPVSVNGKEVTKKLSYGDFVLRAIGKLRTGEYKGIHATYSGLLSAMDSYYGKDISKIATVVKIGSAERTLIGAPAVIAQLAQKGTIATRPARGGVMVYKPADAPTKSDNGKKALASILA